ncbi:MAG: phosphatidylglycerophosphatase A [Magnetococcales bacterium]|nr:phosphatidylglycerophosphatase A [Magnetococcales bacterium]
MNPHSINSISLAVTIATLAGVGRCRYAPGTMGTLATLPLAIAVQQAGPVLHGLVLLLVTLIGTWAADRVARHWHRSDPSEVVIDESAGLLLTLWGQPDGWPWWLAGFLLFRFFDIVKPWPVGWCDRHIPGGWGIMIDDLAAGVWSSLLLAVCHWLLVQGRLP